MNCIKIGLPGKFILRDYFQENSTSQRPFLLLRISFLGRHIFIQFIPAGHQVELYQLKLPVQVRGIAARLGCRIHEVVSEQAQDYVSAPGVRKYLVQGDKSARGLIFC